MSRRLLLALSTLLLGACASGIQVTHYPVEAEKQLGAFKTYCWAIGKAEEAMECLAPGAGHNNFFDATVRASINENLENKGYQPAAACATADFMIDYRIGIHTDVAAADASPESSPQSSIHDYGLKWNIGQNAGLEYKGLSKPEDLLITVQHGTLHIAAFTSAGELLWHSAAEKVLSERENDSTRLANIRKATNRAMAHFPEQQ